MELYWFAGGPESAARGHFYKQKKIFLPVGRKEQNMNKAIDIYRQLKELKAYDISPSIHTNLPAFPAHPNCWIIKNVRSREQHGYNCNVLVIGEHMGPI